MTVRVRFAPSPTGTLHIGTARTALFNWLYARNQKGAFVLRIEDTDIVRSKPEFIEDILTSMKALGLDWDEGPGKDGEYGPYNQLERLEIYKEHAEKLLRKKLVYRCFCSPESLRQSREKAMAAKTDPKYDQHCLSISEEESARRAQAGEPFALRFKTPEGSTVFGDVLRGRVEFNNEELDDFVIMKADGTPTYNFAVTVDDATMKITHVIRGDDHISNTPRQVMIYKAFEYNVPKFVHVPLIHGADRTKLSKRHGAKSVNEYLEDGFLPEALLNFLGTMGCSYKEGMDVMSLQDMIKEFSLKKLNKTAAVFDLEKLNWLNGEHFLRLPVATRVEMVRPDLEESFGTQDPSVIELVLNSFGKRLKSPKDIVEYADYFFTEDFSILPEAAANIKPDTMPLLRKLKENLSTLTNFTASECETVLRNTAKECDVKAGQIIHPMRAAVSGKTIGPGAFELLEMLGRHRVLSRLERL